MGEVSKVDAGASHWRRWLGSKTVWAIAVTLAALGLWAASGLRGPLLKTQQLQRRDLVQSVVASARVEAPHRVELGAQITATVLRVLVREGQMVAAGEPLVELDEREARATLAAAQLAVAQARARLRQFNEVQAPLAVQAERQAAANLAQAGAQFRRQQDLFKQGFIGQAALDEARRVLDVADAQASSARTQLAANQPQGSDLQLARATLAQAEANAGAAAARLSYLRLTAPVAGQIIDREVEPGQVVQPGKVLLRLSPSGVTELVAQIDEKSLGLLQVGQSALASADAYAQQRFKARLSEISPGVDAQRGSVEVRLRVPEPPAYLRQDMTMSVEIEVARRPQALVLPIDAVHEPESAKPWAWRVVDGRLQRADIGLGLRSGGWAEVLRGLQPGELLVTEPTSGLREGQRVRAAGG
ncbi:efflux RND transporter periplasmic adaptor subunit [Paucibacter sp. APW11]|uniref:Efflux RND transporter periplasmic adaptor subunit n=1 Tax=Roseateles aquae TaxID=3077235 RepID=A0ABU3PAP3_9BURK|nr:efflux RND transporter periplasmic adaptor subunit [Paucibacter sp. APW11]MDT8999614.1 efflux RND transporter periplasmic adaptor subunit [Paucibacter sp. APW11]